MACPITYGGHKKSVDRQVNLIFTRGMAPSRVQIYRFQITGEPNFYYKQKLAPSRGKVSPFLCHEKLT